MNDLGDRLWALVPAAGVGRRMTGSIPKQYLSLAGRTVIERTLDRLVTFPAITGVVVVLSPGDPWWVRTDYASHPAVFTVDGGEERCHSVRNGLDVLCERGAEPDWVLVHDAARPCVRHADIERLIRGVRDHPAGGLLGTPVTDTIKQAGCDGMVEATVPRSSLWHAQTPQMFRVGALRAALTKSLADGYLVTDDASAMEHVGHRPRVVAGNTDNVKITRPRDLELAAFFLRLQEDEVESRAGI